MNLKNKIKIVENLISKTLSIKLNNDQRKELKNNLIKINDDVEFFNEINELKKSLQENQNEDRNKWEIYKNISKWKEFK